MASNTANTRSNPPRVNWRIATRAQQGQSVYALAVISKEPSVQVKQTLSNQQFPDVASLIGTGVVEFHFPMTPKTLSLEEPSAVQIVPTQNQGQFIEHQGQIYKNVQIAGTTGLRPSARSIVPAPLAALGITPGSGTPLSSGTDTGLSDAAERTGFDDLMDLRNLFRAYWDAKKDPQKAPKTLMVWQNGKEGEYYIVEPITFRTNRDASSPLTFNYEFTLRTIERLDVSSTFRPTDSFTDANGFDTFISRLNRITQKLTQAFTLASSLIDRVASIGQATITSVLGPVNAILQGLTNVTNAVSRTLAIPRVTVAEVAGSATDLAEALDAAAGNVAYVTQGIDTQFTAAANAYRNIGRTLRAVFAEDKLFAATYSSAVSQKAKSYSDPITGQPNSGGSVLDLNNAQRTNAAGEAVIQVGEDIRGLAQRLLGDSGRWKELVILNALKPPYVSDTGDGISVLAPNQSILYPRSASSPQGAVANTNRARFQGISSLAERMGIDVRLEARQAPGGLTALDIAVGITGDLDLISGIDNLNQAITIKFATEPGELPTHPFFGARLPIGTKAKINSIIQLQVDVRATLLSDSRIQDVSSVRIGFSGNVLEVSAVALVRDDDQILPLDFSVRRQS